MEAEEFISHYGKKGMKWGVHNKTTTVIKKRANSKKDRLSPDAKEISTLRAKKPSTLSNNDLKKINERMNLEQNYNRLNTGKVKKGKQRVEFILATATIGKTAYELINSKAGQAAIKLGTKILDKTADKIVKNFPLQISPYLLRP